MYTTDSKYITDITRQTILLPTHPGLYGLITTSCMIMSLRAYQNTRPLPPRVIICLWAFGIQAPSTRDDYNYMHGFGKAKISSYSHFSRRENICASTAWRWCTQGPNSCSKEHLQHVLFRMCGYYHPCIMRNIRM